MKAIERVCEFLKEAQTYYLATVEGDQPRVRPFGTANIFEGKETMVISDMCIFSTTSFITEIGQGLPAIIPVRI